MNTNMKLSTFLLLTLTHAQVSASRYDIYDTFPEACKDSAWENAATCVINRKCTKKFWHSMRSESLTPMEAYPFDIYSQALHDFYIPHGAKNCGQFADPICEVTSYCSSCKDELDELYRCMIREGDHPDGIKRLEDTCPVDCGANVPRNRGLRGDYYAVIQREEARSSIPDESAPNSSSMPGTKGEPDNLEHRRSLWGFSGWWPW